MVSGSLETIRRSGNSAKTSFTFKGFTMRTVEDFLNVANFLGDEMTDDQASRLMSDAKRVLSISDIERLLAELPGTSFYTEVSMYDGEMGGLSRY